MKTYGNFKLIRPGLIAMTFIIVNFNVYAGVIATTHREPNGKHIVVDSIGVTGPGNGTIFAGGQQGVIVIIDDSDDGHEYRSLTYNDRIVQQSKCDPGAVNRILEQHTPFTIGRYNNSGTIKKSKILVACVADRLTHFGWQGSYTPKPLPPKCNMLPVNFEGKTELSKKSVQLTSSLVITCDKSVSAYIKLQQQKINLSGGGEAKIYTSNGSDIANKTNVTINNSAEIPLIAKIEGLNSPGEHVGSAVLMLTYE